MIPIAMSAVAAALFFLQGGFGGGHGSFDRAIGILGLPAIKATASVGASSSDLLNIVVLPAAINIALWLVVALTVNALLKLRT